jgi:hypothetical protein
MSRTINEDSATKRDITYVGVSESTNVENDFNEDIANKALLIWDEDGDKSIRIVTTVSESF